MTMELASQLKLHSPNVNLRSAGVATVHGCFIDSLFAILRFVLRASLFCLTLSNLIPLISVRDEVRSSSEMSFPRVFAQKTYKQAF